MKRDRLLGAVFVFSWLAGWPAYGDPPEAPLANVALSSSGANITASDSFGNDTPDKLIDGVIDHALTHRWHSEISKGHPHWLRVELARPLPVRRIVLHASAVDCFPTRIAVEYRTADGEVRSLVETALVPARSVAIDLPAVITDNLCIRILDANAGIKGYVQLNALEVLAAITSDEARDLARAATTPLSRTPPLSRGCYVTADSNGVFGRNDPNYGHPDPESSPHRLTSGAWVTQAGEWQRKRWISQMDQPHPHWAWIDLGKLRRIDRVVVRCSSLQNYPTDLRGQYSTDGGVTVKDLFTAMNLVPSARKLAWEFQFKPVVTDNFRLLVEKSASSHSTNYTQVSQIEVYGEDVAAGEATAPPPAPTDSLKDLPEKMLAPSAEQDLSIEERAGDIAVRSPWQKVVFDRNSPVIRSLCWDSVGAGHFELNLLGKEKVRGIRPHVEPAIGPAPPLPAAKAVRDGNVLRYGPFAMGRGLEMTWEVKVGVRTLEMAVATRAARALAVQPGLVRFEFDSGQTPLAPFYKPGKVGLVSLPALLNAPDCGPVLTVSPDGSVAGFRFHSAEYASGAFWSYADLTPEFPTRADRLTVIPAGVRQARIAWTVEEVRPLATLTAAEPRLKELPRYALNGLAFRPDTDVLSNSITSIDCCFCMFEYATVAQFLPPLPGGINATDLLRRSEVSFNRYDLGLPNCLVEIPKPDYVTEDRFQQYLNGGASPCFAYWYIQALYQRGRRAAADAILWPMVRSFDAMLFNGGVGLGQRHPDRQEWHRWDGRKSGGEGFLTDSYLTLNAIYTGHYGITFGPRGYEVAPWSPLKGKRVPVGLEYMGKVVDETE